MMNQTVFEKMRNKHIPDYYPTMYQDGWKPYEILEAAHNSIIKQYMERQEADTPTEDEPMNVRFQVEVKHK